MTTSKQKNTLNIALGLGLTFDIFLELRRQQSGFDFASRYVAPSIAGLSGIVRRSAARKPHVGRQHTEVLSANPR